MADCMEECFLDALCHGVQLAEVRTGSGRTCELLQVGALGGSRPRLSNRAQLADKLLCPREPSSVEAYFSCPELGNTSVTPLTTVTAQSRTLFKDSMQ